MSVVHHDRARAIGGLLRALLCAVGLVASFCLGPASTSADIGDNLFRARYAIGATTDNRAGTNSLINVDNLFSSQFLDDLTGGGYDPLSTPVLANLDLRGVAAVAGFRQDETAFFFLVQAAGIDISFDEGDRDASLAQFQEWLKGGIDTPTSPAEAVTSLFQAFVADSAVDPVAGNPFSLQTRMMQSPYDVAMRTSFRPDDEFEPDENGKVWTGKDVFELRTDYSPFWGGDWNGFMVDLAFDYTLNLKEPRLAFTFDLPIAYTQTEGEAHTVTAHAGVGMLIRAMPWWNVLTEGRVGIAGSVQLGGLAVLYSTGVTSHMQWQLGDATLRMGNAFTASSSIDGIEWFGYELTYAITNYLVRNGFEVEHPLPGRLRGNPLFTRLMFSDNWVLGSDVYVDHYNEVGVHFGTTRTMGSGAVRDRSSFGLTYAGAQDYHSLRVSLNYAF